MVGSTPVVAVDGIIDLSTIPSFHQGLVRSMHDHRGATLVVDLDAAGAIDDAALGILLGAAAAARDAGGDLEVVCTRPVLRDRLARTGFDRAVVVRDTIS